MNILMVAGRVPYPPLDGGSTRVYHLAQQWSRRHRVTIVAPQFGPLDPEVLAACAREVGAELLAVPVRVASRRKRAARYARQALAGEPADDRYPEVMATLAGLARARAFDAVELEGSGAGLYLAAWAGLPARPRTVLVFYDVMWDWWRRQFRVAPRPVALARWLTYRAWEPRLAREVDCCVFMSERDMRLVAAVAPLKSRLVVPVGVELGALAPLPEEPEVLFVGNLAHLPNRQAVEWLLRHIWPALRARVPGVRLTIVGREPAADLARMAQAAGVELAGDAPDVRPYYDRARAVIAPIRSGGGIRVKILEALAMGRPVVTTRLGAEGLPLEPGEHALFADSADEVAAQVARLLSDRALAEGLAANGRALVAREFGWEALAARQERALLGEG